MPEPSSLRNEIAALLERGLKPLSDDEFNAIALRVFAFQFEHNTPYRKYCERRITSVADVRRWQDIPAVPTGAFKEAKLVAGDAARAQAVFRTSGTTRGIEKRGAHYVLDLELYKRSLLPTFSQHVLNGQRRLPMVSLVPDAQQSPDSSLSYMVTVAMKELGAEDSMFAIGPEGIRYAALHRWLEQHIEAGQRVCILGTSLAFLHWFDHMQDTSLSFRLPAGSMVMDTGGFKGSDRSITASDLRAQYTALLGIAAGHVVNEYGMTEMLSQFYDVSGVKLGPPWVRSTIVDPETLDELPPGENGLLRHVDLANLFSVVAIQTEDLGRAKDNGFELLGRIAGATPRGCSIAMDLFLSAAR